MLEQLEKRRYTCRDIARELETYIVGNQLAEGVALSSTVDIARRYDVSEKTVHRAIGHLVDKGMVYRVRGNGTYVRNALSTSNSLRIGIFDFTCATMEIPALDRLAFDNEMQEFYHALESGGHSVELFFDSSPANVRALLRVNLEAFDVIVVKAGYLDNLDARRKLLETKTKIILYGDDAFNYGPWHQVFYDYRNGFKNALLYLCDRKFKEIFVAGCMGLITWERRFGALAGIADEIGFGAEHLHLMPGPVNFDLPVLFGRECGKYFLRHFKCNTAIVSLSDYLIVGIMDALKDHGLQLGRDVILVSYDNLLRQLPSFTSKCHFSSIVHPLPAAYRQMLKLVTEVASDRHNEYFRAYAIAAHDFIYED